MEDNGMTERAPLRIEEATKEDAPTILNFIRELAQYERAVDRVTATEEILGATLFGDRPYAKAIIAYQDDEAVAFAIYFFSYSSFSGEPSLYVEDIFVRPAARGLGLGKEIFTFLARRASEHGCGRMEWSVLNWNEAAIAFYRTLGAVPVRQWTVFHLPQAKLAELAKPAS
jgi:GNAT superfamily N-acetyltransferase